MQTMDFLKKYSLYALLALGIIITSCDDDDEPEAEETPEIITDVVLIFDDGAGDVVRATANDPDGTGVQDLNVQTAPIVLKANTAYTLTYEVKNEDEDVLAEDILKEKEEHQVFYAFTNDIFTSPTGDGNVGATSAADPVNYVDKDGDGNNLGFETTWTTGDAATGKFRVLLQHQPDIKTATSTSEDGDNDFDLEFDLTIQ